jgi:hypothetical protein
MCVRRKFWKPQFERPAVVVYLYYTHMYVSSSFRNSDQFRNSAMV